MSYYSDDTIAAIGTASGGAARGMVRVSGPDAVAIAGRVFVTDGGEDLDGVQRASVVGGRLRIGWGAGDSENPPPTPPYKGGEILAPCDLFLWPTARSYTREPIVELHTVGSPPLLQAALAAVCRAGARLAEPGEFTLRAFLAGRLDLTQAEAVLGVIDAEGSAEFDVALSQLAGGLAQPLYQLREELLQLLAELEAGLDFVEEDIRFIPQAEVVERLQRAAEQLANVELQILSRHTASELRQVVLVGAPNVGKSSLFNALVTRYGAERALSGRQAALVSPQSGTTRDYLTTAVSFDGVRCELVDTAGVLEDELVGELAAIETAAQSHATERRRRAAVRICCVSAQDVVDGDVATLQKMIPESGCDVVALTKADIAKAGLKHLTALTFVGGVPAVVTSSHTCAGLDELAGVVHRFLASDVRAQRGPIVAATADRCGESVRLGRRALETATSLAHEDAGDELVAAEVRAALVELGKVVGAVYTDDLLDRIFSTFCIGK